MVSIQNRRHPGGDLSTSSHKGSGGSGETTWLVIIASLTQLTSTQLVLGKNSSTRCLDHLTTKPSNSLRSGSVSQDCYSGHKSKEAPSQWRQMLRTRMGLGRSLGRKPLWLVPMPHLFSLGWTLLLVCSVVLLPYSKLLFYNKCCSKESPNSRSLKSSTQQQFLHTENRTIYHGVVRLW